MSCLTTIKNEFLTVTVNSLGAELTSVKDKNGKEFMWCGDESIWSGHAPVLFPICGGLKGDKFTYNGKEYSLQKHGYARNSEFTLKEAGADFLTYSLKSTDETKKQYPFDYEFIVSFTLEKNSIKVMYKVINLTDGEMYANFGGHEAYACPGGIENYKVLFEKKENLMSCDLDGNCFKYSATSLGENTDTLELKDDLFEVDAQSFLTLKSEKVTLVEKNSERKITVCFPGFPYLLLWAKYKAPYLCIEPWTGIPDRVDADGDITKKEGIVKIEKGGVFEKTRTITFE